MRICLVKPPILHKGASFALMPTAPLGLAYIAGALKAAGHDIQVVDTTAEGAGRVEHFRGGIYLYGLNGADTVARIRDDAEAVLISCMFTNNWMYDREVIAAIRERFPKALIIAGGEHATAAPTMCLHQAPGLDCVVLGEGEETIVQLLEQFGPGFMGLAGVSWREGRQVRTEPWRRRTLPIEQIAWPAWELFPVHLYFEHRMSHGVFRGNTLPVMASRGCPYDCTFCSSPQMWGRKYQIRPASDFVDELEHLNRTYGATNFDLYDLTAIIYRDWTIEMCEEIVRRGLRITFQLPSGTRSEAIDYEVARHLKAAGCSNITYAPESGSERVLKAVRKKVKVSSMLDSIASSNKAGLNVHLNMIIGFPDDTHRDIWHTLWFLVRCSWRGANDAGVAVFTPYPGSVLFDRLESEGKVDLGSDAYIVDIVESYDLWPGRVYSRHMDATTVKVYVLLLLVAFYGTNYLFRPWRLVRTLLNLLLNRHESRLEQMLYKNFIRNVIRLAVPARWGGPQAVQRP